MTRSCSFVHYEIVDLEHPEPLQLMTLCEDLPRFTTHRWHVVQDIVKPSCAKHGAPIALVRNGTLVQCGGVVSCYQWDVL